MERSHLVQTDSLASQQRRLQERGGLTEEQVLRAAMAASMDAAGAAPHEDNTRGQVGQHQTPDTPTAPTSAHLTNYRSRAYRAYPGDPAGRQSASSITARPFLHDGSN